MTNQEKTIELSEDNNIYDACLEMAEWKDKQFISILSDIFDYFENVIGLYDGGLDHSDVDKPAFIEYFSNIITK